jgi:PAS domain-containing protein
MATLHSPLRRKAPADAACAAREHCSPELAALSLKLAPLAGEAFIDEFARAAAAVSGADYFLIGRLNAYSNVMRSVRLIENGAIAPNITYSLDGTPCARAIDSDTCVYNAEVAAQFPLDRLLADMQIAAYVGTPLRDEDSCPFGVIVALSRTPFEHPSLVSAILDRFRDRVAREVVTLEALERYRLAISSGAGIWDWDLLTGDMFITNSVAKMLGHDGDGREHDLRLIDDAIHPDDRAIKAEALARHMRSGEPFDVVIRLRSKDGVYRWFRMRADAVRNDKGAAVRMVGSVSDVDALVCRGPVRARC